MKHKSILIVGRSLAMIGLMTCLSHYAAHASCLTQPDYLVHDLWCSDTAAGVGELVQVGDVITNICKSTTATTETRIYISTNAAQLMCLWETHTTAPLLKNGSASWSNTLQVPTCAVPGVTNYIICVADGAAGISESNENNNRKSISIYIIP